MARTLTANFITQITGMNVQPIILIGAHFDSGDVFLWNGFGNLVYNGNTYTSAVGVLAIDKVEEQKATIAAGMTLTVSGLPVSMATLVDGEPYQERSLDVNIALLDSTGAIVSTPYQIFEGFMDTMVSMDDGNTITVAITVENMLVRLERSLGTTYTPASQQVEFPTDTGFNFVTDIQNRQVIWG